VDVLFGNLNEFRAFVASSRRLGYKSGIMTGVLGVLDRKREELATIEVVANDETSDATVVVVTDGPAEVLCFEVGREIGAKAKALIALKPSPVDADEIVDTIGAGDSFVAGYAQAAVADKTRRECILRGVTGKRA